MKKCALVIGHKKNSPGAVNKASGLSEFQFNDALASEIEAKVQNVDVQRVYRRTYQTLPGDINLLEPDFIICLHCNAYNESASGTEVLFYHRSSKGKKTAQILQDKLLAALTLNDRGIKPKTSEDRGGTVLRYTKAPCLIAEPFFIDNNNDLATAQNSRTKLIDAYVSAIEAIAEAL